MENTCFHTKAKKFVFLNLMPKRGSKLFCPLPQFLKVGRAIVPQLFRPWSGISEVLTALIWSI
jgi:hypothetical protein